MEKKKLGINIRSRTLFENSYLDDEGRVAVGMNGGRGLTLRALRGHPRSRARIASDAAPGSVLLQIARTPLLSYLQPLKLRRKREKKKEKGKENIKMANEDRKIIYRKDTLLQRFLREALPPRRRVVAPCFEHETTPTVADAAIPSVGRFRRRCHRPTIVRAPQGRQGSPDLLRGFVMARQAEGGARPHSVPVPHPVVPLTLIRACRNVTPPR